jgi:hypothetical protein
LQCKFHVKSLKIKLHPQPKNPVPIIKKL